MSTDVKRRNGGYFTVPNRWVDAGYMSAAPGSVTQVYLHLSRWANNGTLESSQPMRLIARKCGLSEDVTRKAVRTLEAWGVLDRDPDSGRHAKNVWYLNDLLDRAPEYPDKVPPKQSGGPDKVGPQESGGPYQPNQYQPDLLDQPDLEASPIQNEEQNAQPENLTVVPESTPHKQAVAMVQAWAEHANGGRWPVAKTKAIKQARDLVDAGFVPENVPDMLAWARGDDFWGDKALDFGALIAFADKWSQTQHKGPKPEPKFLDYVAQRHYQQNEPELHRYYRDKAAGTLPDLSTKGGAW